MDQLAVKSKLLGKHVFCSYHGSAGTAEEWAADLLWALRDTTINATAKLSVVFRHDCCFSLMRLESPMALVGQTSRQR